MKTFALLTVVAAATMLFAAPAGAHILHPGCNAKLSPKAELRCARINRFHAQATIEWAQEEVLAVKTTRTLQAQSSVLRRLSAMVEDHRWLYNVMSARIAEAKHRLTVASRPVIDSCTATILSREGGMNPLKWNNGYVGVWDPYSTHGGSGAYGGPQALPGNKMASAGPDWATNIWTQIRWMIGYETTNYGSPCGALAFWNEHQSY